MKFSRSERTLHSPQDHTPAANHYQGPAPPCLRTGTLVGPSSPAHPPAFGLAARFNENRDQGPGPGAYLDPGRSQRSQPVPLARNAQVVRQYKKHGFLGGEQRSPSIPYSPFSMDPDDELYARQLRLNEDLSKSTAAIRPKAEGFSFARSERGPPRSLPPRREEPALLAPVAEENRPTMARGSLREQLRRSSERRAEIISRITPPFVPSLELIEMVTRRRTRGFPGPGSYEEVSREAQVQGPGFAQAVRFKEELGSTLGPGQYPLPQPKTRQVSLSRSERQLFAEETDLQHRFYIDPFEAVRRRQQVSGGLGFGSQVVRFVAEEREKKEEREVGRGGRERAQKSRLSVALEARLLKLRKDERDCEQSGLLAISTMASTIG